MHEAENGRDAAKIAQGDPVDLVITDLWMPVMNGVELIQALETMGCPAEVIVLSAHITTSSADRLRSLNVFQILAKPVAITELLGAVRQGLRSDRRGRVAGELARSAVAGPAKPSAGKPMVLVVDDEEVMRSLLRDVLTRAGYRVEEARDGEEAVEKALAYHIDLVVTDLNMPRMNGRQAVEKLRRASRDCFIICMTGECSNDEIQATLRAGAVKCFRKPFDITALLAEVERLDLLAVHRRRLAKWELSRKESFVHRGRSAARGRRFRRMAAAAVAIVAISAAAVPVVSHWLAAAGRTARAAAEKAGQALDGASRLEGYLQRDEARELGNRR